MISRVYLIITLSLSINSAVAQELILARLDHFLAVTESSEELFSVFNDTLRLPAAWPHESYDGFASGGVSVGGSVLELISYADFDGATHFSAVAFLPVSHVPEVRRQLEENGVSLGPNDPYTVFGDGEAHVLWENFDILNVSSDGLRVFICDYKSRDYLEENRAAARKKLVESGGGPLGVVGLAEIQIGASEVVAIRAEWAKLGLHQHSGSEFSAGDGARISIVDNPNESILGITLRVTSLDEAVAWLSQQGMLGSRSTQSVRIAPEYVQGLSITLIE